MAGEDLLIDAGFSASKLAQSAQEVIATAKRTGEQAQKVFNDATSRVTNTEAARANTRALERMAQAYDPVYRAEVRHKKSLDDLNKLLSSGKYTQDQYNAALKRSEDQLRKAGDAAQELGRKGVQGGTGLQNLGYQVGDFAVQVGAGTSAAQALGQQLPQLLGGLGTMGALMGAGAAIAIPLGAALIKVAMDTETLDDKLESLEKTTAAYLDAVDAQATPLEQLRIQYGDLADEIQRANDATASLAQFSARRDLIGSANKFGSTSFGASGWWSNVVGAAQQEAGAQESEVERLARVYRISAEQAERLQMARRRLETSNSEAAVARDAENLRDVLLDIAGNADDAAQRFPEELAKTDILIRTAADQMAAADRAHRQAQQDLLDTYDANTQKLKKLAEERSLAEDMLTQAVKDGNAERADAARRALKSIDTEVQTVKRSIAEMDGTFEASVARMKEMAAGLGGALSGAIKGWTGMSPTEWTDAGAASQKGILDLIAQRESGGDYNATLDHGRWTGGARSLVNMTLSEIRALQEAMRTPENKALYGNGKGSSALGRYQIVGSTLDDLMKRLNLTGDELFSAEMQDRLAMELLRQIKPGDVEGIRGVWPSLGSVPPALIQQAWNQQSIDRVDPEIAKDRQKALNEEIKRRENLAKQAKEYGEQLSRNLLSEQKQAELAKQQADQIAAIKASDLGAKEQATAIAAVNAEIEKQRLVYTLLEEAKRRQVDLDAMLTDGTMTYRQAIEALGEQKRQQIIVDEQRAQAEQKAAERAEFAAQAQETLKNGLLDAIVAGESFADVLANVAQMLARAALQAALFGEGPFASGGSGGGLLGSLFGAFGFGGQRVTGGDALSNALRGISGFRANGGSVQSGKVYGVGEQGPELFVPSVSGAILNVAQAQAALRGGQSGGSFSFNPTINVGGNVTQDDIARIHQVMEVERKNFIQNVRRAQAEIGQRYN